MTKIQLPRHGFSQNRDNLKVMIMYMCMMFFTNKVIITAISRLIEYVLYSCVCSLFQKQIEKKNLQRNKLLIECNKKLC
jgi:hypothetical protein